MLHEVDDICTLPGNFCFALKVTVEARRMDAVLEKHPSSTARIRFQDSDPYGHLNNARYLDYFFNAREAHLRDFYGLDFFGEDFKECNWVVGNSTVSHERPAVNNQIVVIQTGLVQAAKSTVQVEGLMLNEDRSQLLAAAWVEFVFVNLSTGRPTRHDPQLM